MEGLRNGLFHPDRNRLQNRACFAVPSLRKEEELLWIPVVFESRPCNYSVSRLLGSDHPLGVPGKAAFGGFCLLTKDIRMCWFIWKGITGNTLPTASSFAGGDRRK